MNYNQATLHAATGKILMLPGWHGYFYWNYGTKELNFRDGDYHLDSSINYIFAKVKEAVSEETLMLFLLLATTFLKNTLHIAPIH